MLLMFLEALIQQVRIQRFSSVAFITQTPVTCVSELKDAVEDVLPSLTERGVTVLLMSKHCHAPGLRSFSDEVDQASDAPVPRCIRSHVTLESPAVYIYTSGTTGDGGCTCLIGPLGFISADSRLLL